MKLTRLILPALALSLASSSLLLAQNGPPQDHPQEGPGQQHQDMNHGGWDAPPQEFRDVQRQGFRDGIQAARRDIENHRPPNPEWAAEFRRPPVPRPSRDDYRDGFRLGYKMALSHSHEGMGSMPMPMPMAQNGPPQNHGGWDAPPQEFRDVQRQGFHDGIEAARGDFQMHRPLRAERRSEFRHPPVSRESRDEYREGFRRGYTSAFSHFREDHDHHGDDHGHN